MLEMHGMGSPALISLSRLNHVSQVGVLAEKLIMCT